MKKGITGWVLSPGAERSQDIKGKKRVWKLMVAFRVSSHVSYWKSVS